MHKPLSPGGIHPPFSSYSHGIEIVSRSRLVFCSGQLGIAPDAEVPPDCEGQARLCFENIRAILAEAGMDFRHIVRLNAYVAGREHVAEYMRVRNELISEPWPASTLLLVPGFPREEFLLEIEAVAAAAG